MLKPQPEDLPDLKRIRNIIRRGWTQGASARLANGKPCSALNSRAKSWCLWGAVNKADATGTAIIRALQHYDYIGWNDQFGRTQEEVLAVLDAAIADSIKQEKEIHGT